MARSSDPANALVWGPEAELDDLVAAGLAGAATMLWEPVFDGRGR